MSVRETPLANMDRRTLLKAALGVGLVPATAWSSVSPAQAQLKTNPFTLGIASGDPAADGFVLWTRLAPQPQLPRGGMPASPVEVTWELANAPDMKEIVRTGTAMARVELAHSVHAEIEGLAPARDYFYRFRAGGIESPVGRARTLPMPGADVAQLRFAVLGCQQWEGGFYTGYRHVADEAFDFIFHYGDYIYENRFVAAAQNGKAFARVLPKDFPNCISLLDYRRRYGFYKSDPDLQAAHASAPFLMSFDDHEVANDWASDTDPRNTPAEAFLFRRAAAFQAWYEHMPVRRALLPRGPDILAYRSLRYGTLADIAVLDTRQYRSKQPCGNGLQANCKEADAQDHTMIGAQQERWLADTLRAQTGTWQVLAQQVLFAPLDWRSVAEGPDTAPLLAMDKWDGASASRDRVRALLKDARVTNPVVLSGDLHIGLALELKEDFGSAASPCVGVEFLGSSISSSGDGTAVFKNADAFHTNNPHLKFISNQRGYTRHVVTPKHWQADFRIMEQIQTAGAPIVTRKSFVVEAGRPALNEA
jgi:alkaline phosphatase D